MRVWSALTGPAALVLTLALGAGLPAMAAAAANPIEFDSGPPPSTNQTTATFNYHDINGPTTFECKVDSGAFVSPCPAPHTVSGLAEGTHTFTVQETSTAGAPPSNSYTWTVDLTPPTTEVTGRPPALTNSTTATFTPLDVGPPPHKDSKAFRGYYIILGEKGYAFTQDIGDEFFFSPSHAPLVAERCGTCGVVEFDFKRYTSAKLHKLAAVDLNSSDNSGDFSLINVPLPAHQLEGDGMGLIVIRAVSGRPRISGIGITN